MNTTLEALAVAGFLLAVGAVVAIVSKLLIGPPRPRLPTQSEQFWRSVKNVVYDLISCALAGVLVWFVARVVCAALGWSMFPWSLMKPFVCMTPVIIFGFLGKHNLRRPESNNILRTMSPLPFFRVREALNSGDDPVDIANKYISFTLGWMPWWESVIGEEIDIENEETLEVPMEKVNFTNDVGKVMFQIAYKIAEDLTDVAIARGPDEAKRKANVEKRIRGYLKAYIEQELSQISFGQAVLRYQALNTELTNMFVDTTHSVESWTGTTIVAVTIISMDQSEAGEKAHINVGNFERYQQAAKNLVDWSINEPGVEAMSIEDAMEMVLASVGNATRHQYAITGVGDASTIIFPGAGNLNQGDGNG